MELVPVTGQSSPTRARRVQEFLGPNPDSTKSRTPVWFGSGPGVQVQVRVRIRVESDGLYHRSTLLPFFVLIIS
jgi:hypothetical protein